MANSKQWAELLEPGLRQIFVDEYNTLAASSRIPLLFDVTRSDRAAETDLTTGGFGTFSAYQGAIEYDEPVKGFETVYTHQEFAKGFVIERALYDDDQYNVIRRKPQDLALAAMRTREQHAADIFNHAFDAAHAGGDGVALCAAHPLNALDPTTHSNAGSTALSYDAVVATRKLMRAYVDPRGMKMAINPDTLIVPAELEDTAWTIVNTIGKPGTPNNDANFVRGQGIGVVVWDYLTDANNWFMADSRLMKRFLLWFDRVALEFAVDPTSDFDLRAKYRGYMRYSQGWSDWRWVYGHQAA